MTEQHDGNAFVELAGARYEYVRYGHERNDDGSGWFDLPCHSCGAEPGALHAAGCRLAAGTGHSRPRTCRDCGTAFGSYHVGGCVVEQCPRCGGQFVSCDCDETASGVPIEFEDDGEE